MKKFLLFVLTSLASIGCDRMSNRLDEVALECGADALTFSDARFVLPMAPTPIDAKAWQGIELRPEGYRSLARSSRGCLIVGKDVSGPVYFRHANAQLGATVQSDALASSEVKLIPTTDTAAGLEAKTLSLSCGPAASNQYQASWVVQQQPAPQLHHYFVSYELYPSALAQEPLSRGQIAADAQSLELPKVISDGAYTLRYKLIDAFDSLYAAVPDQTLDCPFKLDTKAPNLLGFADKLTSLSSGSQTFQEIRPGKAIAIKAEDSASTADIFYCAHRFGEPACNDFSALNGTFTAPLEGMWTIRYYATDAAGNRSAIKELPTLAVMNRDKMQNVEALLVNARLLQGKQGDTLRADLAWLEAYDAYRTLSLPLEREPLADQLGLTYSEISRGQTLRSAFTDHLSPVVKLLELGPGMEAGYASLDQRGDLRGRSLRGDVLFSATDVSDIIVHPRFGLILAFTDGSYQLGVDGPKQKFPANFSAKKLALDETGERLFAFSSSELAAFKILAGTTSLLWRRPVAFEASEISLSPAQNLGIVVGAKSMFSFQLDSGVDVASQAWDPRCLFSVLANAESFGWYVGLKEGRVMGPTEPFHCNLYGWNGRSSWQIVDPVAVHAPNDPTNPEDYRFEVISSMVYVPSKKWLVFCTEKRPLFGVLDLAIQKFRLMEVDLDEFQDSEVSAINVSRDGFYLGVANSKSKDLNDIKTEIRVWDLRRTDEALNFSNLTVEKSINENGRAISQLLVLPRDGQVVSADEGRQVRYQSFNRTLLPVFQTDLRPDFSPYAARDLSLLVGNTVERRSRFGDLISRLDAPREGTAGLGVAANDLLLVLGRDGRLWQAAGDAWTLAFDTGLSFPPRDRGDEKVTFLLNGQRNKLLLSGFDASLKPLTLVLELSNEGVWQKLGSLELAPRLASWNEAGTHFAIDVDATQRLFTSSGRELASRSGSWPTDVYVPFSAERWLTAQEKILEIYDIAEGKWLSSIERPSKIKFLSFAGSNADRLWVQVQDTGRTFSVLELAIDAGAKLRDFRSIDSLPRLIFERQAKPWLFDLSGRVFTLGTEGQEPTLIINNRETGGETLFGLNSAENFILGSPRDDPHKLTVLHLSENVKQFESMCAWLEPHLRAAQTPESERARRACQKQIP